jgi:hypothetical protein
MQDAVIAMAIIVVVLALWRWHSRPAQWGPAVSWAGTNIFGPATLGLLSSAKTGENGNRPPAGAGGQPIPVSNTPPSVPTSVAASGSTQPAAIPAPAVSHQTLSASPSNPNEPVGTNVQLPVASVATNLSEIQGPVTVVAVSPSDLGETPAESSAMERRLSEVGAKGGDIQISLFWKNHNDLDLHCIDPQGEEICYSNKISKRTGGELDVDQNAHPPYNDAPVENIYWPAGGAPPGLYRVTVVHYAGHGGTDPTAFTVRTVIQGRTNFFHAAVTYAASRPAKPVCAFQNDPASPDPSRRVRFVP